MSEVMVLRCIRKRIGVIILALGILILGSLLFPNGFWWFVLAVFFIFCGISLLKK